MSSLDNNMDLNAELSPYLAVATTSLGNKINGYWYGCDVKSQRGVFRLPLHGVKEPYNAISDHAFAQFMQRAHTDISGSVLPDIWGYLIQNRHVCYLFEDANHHRMHRAYPGLPNDFPWPGYRDTVEQALRSVSMLLRPLTLSYRSQTYRAQAFNNNLAFVDIVDYISDAAILSPQFLYAADDTNLVLGQDLFVPVMRNGNSEVIRTRLAKVVAAETVQDAKQDTYEVKFGYLEHQFFPGDSGSPVIARLNEEFYLAGSLHFNSLDNRGQFISASDISDWQATAAGFFADPIPVGALYIQSSPLAKQKSSLNNLHTEWNNQLKNVSYFSTQHLMVGPAVIGPCALTVHANRKECPILIEVMEPQGTDEGNPSAIAKIESLFQSGRLAKNPVALVIGLTLKATDFNETTRQTSLTQLQKTAAQIQAKLSERQLPGVVIPISWKPTQDNAGYVFPFLEARAMLSLHPDVGHLHEGLRLATGQEIVIRGMDADVAEDPLFTVPARHTENYEKALQTQLKNISINPRMIMSGGYSWKIVEEDAPLIQPLLDILNSHETEIRKKLSDTFGYKAIYWPEPNVYTSVYSRIEAGLDSLSKVKDLHGRAQQKESTFLVTSNLVEEGKWMRVLPTQKPVKNHVDSFLSYLRLQLRNRKDLEPEALRKAIQDTHQTHLNVNLVFDVLAWHGHYNESIREAVIACVDAELNSCVANVIQRYNEG